MAKYLMSVHWAWYKTIKPNRVGTFTLSIVPRFVEKLTDIIGLYAAAPQHAVVL